MPSNSLTLKKWLSLGALAMALPLALLAAQEEDGHERHPQSLFLLSEAGDCLAEPNAGWLAYLDLLAQRAEAKEPGGEAAVAARARLEEWAARIAAEPDVLQSLRGVQEWAYLSPVDGSGQPFRINIPTDYDPANPAPLSLYLHGYSGNHLEHSTYMEPHTGFFEVAVLGRSRGSQYRGLGEVDVLHVLEFVKEHWNIDESRVWLTGGSMGGQGTLWLGARHPDLFASARPVCGFALPTPVTNLLTLPIYAVHSRDDDVVNIGQSHGPLTHLRDMGGRVIMEMTDGYKHAAWDWAEGNTRAREWEQRQLRPDSWDITHLDYSAVDGMATGAWWAWVEEWGPASRPARFILNASPDNTLYAELDNISRLRVSVIDSPLDDELPLHVSVNGGRTLSLPSPLPDEFQIVSTSEGWTLATESFEPEIRPHTPGGAILLYDGTPLLIVYGTGGDSATQAALKEAAEIASRSPNPAWPGDAWDPAPDGVSHFQNLYGNLPVKADSEVSEEDIEYCHLVLIGTAAQNRLVARVADELPVRVEGDAVVCSDGARHAFAGNMLGLVHYNPLSPRRLLWWVASDDAAAYRVAAPVPFHMQRHGYGVDFMLAGVNSPTFSSARSFDNKWAWAAPADATPLLPAGTDTLRLQGRAASKTAGTDFAAIRSAEQWGAPTLPSPVAGVTRYADLALLMGRDLIYVGHMTGAQLRAAYDFQQAHPRGWFIFEPEIDPGALDDERTYRIAFNEEATWAVTSGTNLLVTQLGWTGLLMADAIMNTAE